MTLYRFEAAGLDPYTVYRIDTASGSTTPAAITGPELETITGSQLKAHRSGRLSPFLFTAATLYAKPLTYQGVAGTPVTLTGVLYADAAPPTSGGGGGAVASVVGQTGVVTGTQIVADAAVVAALAAKAGAVQVATPTTTASTATTGTLTAGVLALVDSTSASLTRTLPTAAAAGAGGVVAIRNVGTSTTNTVTIQRAGSDTINVSGTSRVLTYPEIGITLVSDGVAGWTVVSTDTPASSLTGTYVPIAGPAPGRRREFPMRTPRVLGSPPATATNASSQIAGSVLVRAVTPGAFTALGGRATVNNPANPHPSGLNMGDYPQITSPAPVTIEFWLDTVDATGRFEIQYSGANGIRVAIQQADGSWGYVSAAATFAHAGASYDLVTLGAAGTYRIRVEHAPVTVFLGIQCGPTDTITATRTGPRYLVVGDSFSEPTIDDSGAYFLADGWPVQLAYLTGYDIWCAGSGGTGYLYPGARVKFRDRLANDILSQSPDGIIWAGGINDYGNFTAAQIGAEALLCYQQAAAAGVKDQVILSPFWPFSLTSTYSANLLATSDAIAAAAAQVKGTRFLNLLEMPEQSRYLANWAGATLQSGAAPGNTTISVDSVPSYFAIAYVTKSGWTVRIGTGSAAEVRSVSNITGTGPYTLTVPALSATHSAGDPVRLSGAQYMTGTGKQGATNGTGNSDRYTGNGGTHPTKAGHAYIARIVAQLWAQSLSG